MKYALNTRHENKEEKPRINPYVFISKTILIKNSLENSKEIKSIRASLLRIFLIRKMPKKINPTLLKLTRTSICGSFDWKIIEASLKRMICVG
ncbi:uncharacterized protein METZ01_LOCUS385454 [marine metagenome]|uniref:Uncharacterized protein n=1 Tax=marine metagenome TaxID=408172 RepID=A0A382UED3_9ZZZZ